MTTAVTPAATTTAPAAMPTDAVYIEKLAELARLLRQEGFAVGLGECEDACRLLAELGFHDRGTVKDALRAVFAKSRQEQTVFDRVFDSFFISVEQKQANLLKNMQEQEELDRRRQEAEQELRLGDESLGLSDEMMGVYASMEQAERDRLRRFMDRYKKNYDLNPDLYGGFIRSVFMRSLMEQQMMMEDAALGREELDPDLALMFRDISQIREAEIPMAIQIIQRVARQINGENTARRARTGHGSALDFRRTIRKGLETGGSFRTLKYKRRHARRRRLVLLCDVSASMLQFSEFVLRFIKSLSDVSDFSRTILFSEETMEVDPFALQNMDAFRAYVRGSGLFGKGTDLGRALEAVCAARPPVLGPSTTLIILSDAKTVDLSRAAQELVRAKHLAGRVVWLNPIPRRKWERLRSVQTMSLLCQMVPCSTLSELARECAKLLTV